MILAMACLMLFITADGTKKTALGWAAAACLGFEVGGWL